MDTLYHLQVMIYNSLTQTWKSQKTTGDIPTKCSGAAATVIGDTMYVVAGFHKVVISAKYFRDGKLFGHEPDQFESDSDTEDDESGGDVNSVEISNKIWSLDLISWVWTRLSPAGDPPLRCDKTACWSDDDKVYIFGGFGPPPSNIQLKKQGSLFQFCEDPSSSGIHEKYFIEKIFHLVLFDSGFSVFTRGWSNQLVCYNTSSNRWEWPLTSGVPPSPRAAHSVAVVGGVAYVFGGRHLDNRLNDLYSLNMTSLRWSLVISDTSADNIPVGRSWQTMTSINTGHQEGGLVIYGGFDTSMQALGDCWRMDLHQQPNTWVRCHHLEQGPRLWHASVDLDHSQIMIIGGLVNNILAPSYVSKHHADRVIFLRTAPASLLKLCLEYITKHKELFNKDVEDLPINLRRIVELRCSSGA